MNFLQRLYVFVPLAVGFAIALAFATLVQFSLNYTPFCMSLTILYLVVAWDLRWWRQIRAPLFVAIAIGGICLGYWEPLISSRHSHSLPSCLFSPCCGLSGITYGMFGACIAATLATLATTYDKNADHKSRRRITMR